MIWLTGDLHGNIDFDKLINWSIGSTLNRNDYLIILGDFGLDINYNPKWLNLLKRQPWTTLFVDGNHEHFPYLNSLPKVSWRGGIVGRVYDNIFHLRRGQVYTINSMTFFTMGGATSIDKYNRIEGRDWFREEIPNNSEWSIAIESLTKHNFKVDYVLTHTMPSSAAKIFLSTTTHSYLFNKDSILEKDFDNFIDKTNLDFSRWFCGHWHPDKMWSYDKYCCLYNDIIKLL